MTSPVGLWRNALPSSSFRLSAMGMDSASGQGPEIGIALDGLLDGPAAHASPASR